jgi:hypothetical protein
MVNWEAPVNNGATVTEYRVEWQHKTDLDFMQVKTKFLSHFYYE